MRRRQRRLQLILNPFLDIAPPVADMSTHSETGRPFSAVTPLVEGGDGDTEVFGKVLDGEQPVLVFHAFYHPRNPVDSLSFDLKACMTGFSTLC